MHICSYCCLWMVVSHTIASTRAREWFRFSRGNPTLALGVERGQGHQSEPIRISLAIGNGGHNAQGEDIAQAGQSLAEKSDSRFVAWSQAPSQTRPIIATVAGSNASGANCMCALL